MSESTRAKFCWVRFKLYRECLSLRFGLWWTGKILIEYGFIEINSHYFISKGHLENEHENNIIFNMWNYQKFFILYFFSKKIKKLGYYNNIVGLSLFIYMTQIWAILVEFLCITIKFYLE